MTSVTAYSGALGSLASYLQRTLHDDAITGIIRSWHLRDHIPRVADPGNSVMVKLISFDIDGTLEVGRPPRDYHHGYGASDQSAGLCDR